ncbi:MAG: hypothetical protein WHS89_04125 [Acidimicrobiales bacterium]
MDAQLRLLATADARAATPTRPGRARPWQLSSTTREIGRRGIAQAREALAAARRANPAGGTRGRPSGHGREAA